ncbi:MAG: carboxylesterase family protein [Myxococcota bacterium]|nr:carboxylesterase family protein [Myxococcota bacterium]
MTTTKLSRASLSWLALASLLGCGGDVAAVIDGGSDAFVEPPAEVDLGPLGIVRGAREDGYQEFLGIPYAEPPVGELRWRAPVPHAGWDGALEAMTAPPACAQSALGLTSSDVEDCLFLNVHTPDPRPEGAPVMVWIHGGAFVFGEGLQLDRGTAGDVLAQRYGMIVVSMNYRLGAFGFLADSALGASGNEGFEDQQLALRWVRDHIAAFGGDPAQVTIAGESAGGISVCHHLVAPGSRGLFARAISQSGLCDSPLTPRDEAAVLASRLAMELGCASASDPAACMREQTAMAVREAAALEGDVVALLGDSSRFGPSIDGTVIPSSFRAAVEGGEVADVPVVMGWNADEGTFFIALAEQQGTVVDEAAYRTAIDSLALSHGIEASAIEAAYPLASYDDPGAAIAAMIGHASLACPSRRAALLLASRGIDLRVYRFEYPDAPFQLAFERPLGAFHSGEIQYVFGHPARIGRREHLGDDLALFEAMSGYWARFVRTADPNGEGAPAWPAFAIDTEPYLAIDRVIAAREAADREACRLWDGE